MNSFRLDECANSKALKAKCQDENLVAVHRFPDELRNRSIKDPAVLERIVKDGMPLLTTDGRIVEKHARDIPNRHPGIAVIKNIEKRPMTEPVVMRVLAGFKQRLPGWNLLSIENSIVEFCQDWAVVVTITEGKVESEQWFLFKEPDWADRFLAAIQVNSRKSAPLPPSL